MINSIRKKRLTECFCCHALKKNYFFTFCTLIGAIILSINIQVGLNMHLYDDIGDASSSLRGSTSSYASPTSGEAYRDRWLTTNFEL